MPRTSEKEVQFVDHGLVEVGTVELEGVTVDYLTIKQEVDMTFMLRGLPDNRCQCPHWGILNKGSMIVRYADREETVLPGDAFHMAPGHIPSYEVGTELVQFSPTEELKATDEAIQRNLAALQSN